MVLFSEDCAGSARRSLMTERSERMSEKHQGTGTRMEALTRLGLGMFQIVLNFLKCL